MDFDSRDAETGWSDIVFSEFQWLWLRRYFLSLSGALVVLT